MSRTGTEKGEFDQSEIVVSSTSALEAERVLVLWEGLEVSVGKAVTVVVVAFGHWKAKQTTDLDDGSVVGLESGHRLLQFLRLRKGEVRPVLLIGWRD